LLVAVAAAESVVELVVESVADAVPTPARAARNSRASRGAAARRTAVNGRLRD